MIPEPIKDFSALWQSWRKTTHVRLIEELASKLNSELWILDFIGCAWSVDDFAWGFRLFDDENNVVGIRLINAMGQKFVVRGSKGGSIYNKASSNDDIEAIKRILDIK